MSFPKSSMQTSGGVNFKGIAYSSLSSFSKEVASSKLIEKSIPDEPTFTSNGS